VGQVRAEMDLLHLTYFHVFEFDLGFTGFQPLGAFESNGDGGALFCNGLICQPAADQKGDQRYDPDNGNAFFGFNNGPGRTRSTGFFHLLFIHGFPHNCPI